MEKKKNKEKRKKKDPAFSFCRQCRPLIIIPPRIYIRTSTHTHSVGAQEVGRITQAQWQTNKTPAQKRREIREWSADNLPSIVKVAVREAESA
jgi:hypothetical protein